jgi:hypothetical protein
MDTRKGNRFAGLLGIILLAASWASPSHGLEIAIETDENVLADVLTLGGSTGISVTGSSLQFQSTGPGSASVGTYTNVSGTYNLPFPGIVISSGNVLNYGDGPNTDTGFTTNYGAAATAAQEALLDPITGGTFDHFDVTQYDVNFDVDAGTDGISFLAAFGSEEWSEFVGSTFIDGFGLYLNGTNIAGVGGLTVNINHPDMSPIPGTELDAVLAPNGNPLLRFDAPVTPGSTGNTLTFIVADTSDDALDTTTYFAAFGAEGSSEFIPILPSNDEPPFEFEIPVPDRDTVIWVDPVVAVGYDYAVTSGPNFASVTMPTSVQSDPFEVYLFDGTAFVFEALINPGQTHDFGVVGVDQFRILGIDPNLGLDPNDFLAFPTGLTWVDAGLSEFTMTPIEESVGTAPEPASLTLLGVGLFGIALMNRRRKASVARKQ